MPNRLVPEIPLNRCNDYLSCLAWGESHSCVLTLIDLCVRGKTMHVGALACLSVCTRQAKTFPYSNWSWRHSGNTAIEDNMRTGGLLLFENQTALWFLCVGCGGGRKDSAVVKSLELGKEECIKVHIYYIFLSLLPRLQKQSSLQLKCWVCPDALAQVASPPLLTASIPGNLGWFVGGNKKREWGCSLIYMVSNKLDSSQMDSGLAPCDPTAAQSRETYTGRVEEGKDHLNFRDSVCIF